MTGEENVNVPDWIMELVQYVPEWAIVLIGLLVLAHPVASAIVAMTPTPADDIWYGKIYKWIERLALVMGKAKQPPPNNPNP